MIWVKCLNGPFSGERRVVELDFIDPVSFFSQLVAHGWRWETDYSQATEEETFLFFRAEIVARIMRALENGLLVKFLGQSYRVDKNNNLMDVAQKIEDAIVSSGRMITIDSDNEQGLVIGVCGFEN